jgi:endoglucanase
VLLSLLTLLSYGALTAQARLPAKAAAPRAGYWHTAGSRIVDSTSRTVRIAAVNWFGMEDRYYVPAGLEHRPLDDIIARVAQLGFNAIRLPFSNELVERNPLIQQHIQANPGLRGLHALQVLDRIVAAAGRHHLRIILENARSNAGTVPQQNGLWYTPQYPERVWLHDWVFLAKRYQGNPTVVGMDLRDEPHTAGPGPWSLKTYLHQGATWGPYAGISNPATDWRAAAERAGNAILAVNPHLLIIVEGIQQYPDPKAPRGVSPYWWGGVLYPAATYPVQLAVPHQLVYSPHEYGPNKSSMPYVGPTMTYAVMVRVWQSHWGLFLPPGKQQTPIFLGEFGTCGSSPRCVADTKPRSQGLWFSFLMRYLREHPQIGWAFWALNGTSHSGDPIYNYILSPDWQTVHLPALMTALRRIQH